MRSKSRTPADVARSLAGRSRSAPIRNGEDTAWRRETFVQPRAQARDTARAWFARFPKAAYMTEVESWRELEDGRIEFTMRRLPSAD